MYAIRNKRTRKWLFGTDYRYHYFTADGKRSNQQRTSSCRAITWETKEQAENELRWRHCGKDYEVVAVRLEALE